MQDGKNLLIAIVLCLIVIVGWGYLAEYMGWATRPAPVAQQSQDQQAAQPQPQPQAQAWFLYTSRCV